MSLPRGTRARLPSSLCAGTTIQTPNRSISDLRFTMTECEFASLQLKKSRILVQNRRLARMKQWRASPPGCARVPPPPFFFVALKSTKSVSLKCEPSSEPLHIPVPPSTRDVCADHGLGLRGRGWNWGREAEVGSGSKSSANAATHDFGKCFRVFCVLKNERCS